MNSFSAIHRFCRAERGETLVEFAISAVITLSLLFGIMDLARALYTYHFISYAAQEGARFAEVHGSGWTSACNSQTGADYPDQLGCTASPADIQAYVQSLTPAAVTKANVSVTPQWLDKDINGNTGVCATTNNYAGCVVRVTVSYQFNYIVPFLPRGAQTLSSTAQAVIQQ
jgi:Flp pilus assembly protein TadG